MKQRIFLALVFAVLTEACSQSQTLVQQVYPENVGDIAFDEKIDSPGFNVCNEKRVFQYYNSPTGFPFEGEKIKLVEIFDRQFNGKKFGNQSGYITIRFIVNCEGKSGRFRIQQMNPELMPKSFDGKITDALLQTTKNLNGWIIASNGVDNFDYYVYLTFKIENGTLTQILP